MTNSGPVRLLVTWIVSATMYGCRTPPDVVSGTDACKGSRPDVDSTSTPRRPSGGTHRIRDENSPDFMVTTSLTSLSPVITSASPLTSSTPERASRPYGKPPRTASRHVDFLLDESATSSETSSPCLDVTNGGSPICRPTDLDVGQPLTNWNGRRRQTKSMIVIGEDDVDELFQPVNINGDSFALLQAPIRSSNSLTLTFLLLTSAGSQSTRHTVNSTQLDT